MWTHALIDAGVSIVLLLVALGWIGVVWLWGSEVKSWWGHRHWRHLHSKRFPR